MRERTGGQQRRVLRSFAAGVLRNQPGQSPHALLLQERITLWAQSCTNGCYVAPAGRPTDAMTRFHAVDDRDYEVLASAGCTSVCISASTAGGDLVHRSLRRCGARRPAAQHASLGGDTRERDRAWASRTGTPGLRVLCIHFDLERPALRFRGTSPADLLVDMRHYLPRCSRRSRRAAGAWWSRRSIRRS